jgi:CxxC-x17-CxxC domain-containing protein
MEFVDRILTCTDCGCEFIFTAGEQLFFQDKQFKNDPKRCKPCKSRRGVQTANATAGGPVAAGISRTETRTECSECGIETTVPFKPTQGRPVLCRLCYKNKTTVPSASAEQIVSAPAPQTASTSSPAPADGTSPVSVAAELAPAASSAPAAEHCQPPRKLAPADAASAI